MTRIAGSAVVEEGATIGVDTVIWDLAQVRTGAVLGRGCTIGRNVFIDAGVRLGDGCKVQNNALIYAPASLGNGVFVGPGAILTNDRFPRAVDPSGAPKAAGEWEAAGVLLDDGASIGAGAVIVAGYRVGAWALVGAGAIVVSDVPSHALVVGNPARRVGWVGRSGAALEVVGAGTLRCPATGATFVDHGDRIEATS